MKQINLYQAAFHPRRVVLPARELLAGAGLFLLGLILLAAWDAWQLAALHGEVVQLQRRAADLETRVKISTASRQVDPQLLAETTALEGRLRHLESARQAIASGALGSPTGYAAQFRALARSRVEGAWLTRIEIDEGGRALTLSGRALDGDASARLIAGLKREPLFAGLHFATLNLAPPKSDEADAAKTSKPWLEFRLGARPAPAPATTPAAQAASLLGRTP